MPRYRFHQFTLSPRRRTLLRDGRELPLIPRYFDLLLFLVERRGEAIHRREIFDRVWSDVIVSDSALSQAIRTIRRVLDDDPREPRFVRTVSRHGYEFVCVDVVEEEDASAADPVSPDTAGVVDQPPSAPPGDPYAPLLDVLMQPAADAADAERQRDAAERLHVLGTAEALRRLDAGAASAHARALLRDTRWAVAESQPVPILGAPSAVAVARELVVLRLREAIGLTAARWTSATIGGGLAGAIGGALGGLLLAAAPGSVAPLTVAPVLAVIGAVCGAAGAAGVAAGLLLGETAVRSYRRAAITLGAAAGGATIGLLAQLLATWTLDALVGHPPAIGGGLEGLALGLAAGLAFAASTPSGDGGFAAPRGCGRVTVTLAVAAACGLAGLALDLAAHPLVGGTIHRIAEASGGGQAALTPLGRLIGEPGFGPWTAALISLGEGAAFGTGLALGLTHRRRLTADTRNS